MAQVRIDGNYLAAAIGKKGCLRFPLQDIRYIDVYRHEIYVHTRTKKILIRSTMDILTELLKEKGFIRIHRSYLANRQYIEYIKGNDIVMDNGEYLPLSRHKRQRVLGECGGYMFVREFTKTG